MKNFIIVFLSFFIFSGGLFGQNVVDTVSLTWEKIGLPDEPAYLNYYVQNGELIFSASTDEATLLVTGDGVVRRDAISGIETIIDSDDDRTLFPHPTLPVNVYYAEEFSGLAAYGESTMVYSVTKGQYFNYYRGGRSAYNTPYTESYISFNSGITWRWHSPNLYDNFIFSNGLYIPTYTDPATLPFNKNEVKYAENINEETIVYLDTTIFRKTQNTDWKIDAFPEQEEIISMSRDNDFLYYSTKKGLFREITPFSLNFERIYDTEQCSRIVYDLKFSNNNIYCKSSGQAIIFSPDLGKSWEIIHLGIGTYEDFVLLQVDSQLLLKTDYSGVFQLEENPLAFEPTIKRIIGNSQFLALGDTLFSNTWRSWDNGCNWEQVLNSGNTKMLKYSNGNIVGNQYYSTDFGETWELIPFNTSDMEVSNDTLMALRKDDGLYRSTDFGKNWTPLYPKGKLGKPYKVGNTWVALSEDAIYISENGGDSWFQTSDNYGHQTWVVDSIIVTRLNSSDDCIISKDFGLSWYLVNIPSAWQGLLIHEGFLYNGPVTYSDNSLYRIPLDFLPFNEPQSPYGFLQGNLFVDRNSDCSLNSADVPFSNEIIEFEPGPIFTTTGNEGNFGIYLKADSFSVNITPPKYHEPCIDPIKVGIKRGLTDTLNLGIRPIPGNPDLKVNIMNLNRARPGFPLNFQIQIENIGTEVIENGRLEIHYPKDYLEILNAPNNATVTDEMISFSIDALDLYSNEVYQLETRLLPSVPISEEFDMVANIPDDFADKNILDNTDTLGIFTRGAFDPNDKQLLSGGTALAGIQEMEYLIRFQNTGTDTAFTVEVRDTLHPKFDLASLETIQTSHDYQLKIEENRVVSWKFDNILLVDSFTNEPLSHGFINFKIKTKYPVLPDEKIENSAAIYFDFNEPIITNNTALCAERGFVFTEIDTIVCAGKRYRYGSNSHYPYENITLIDTTSFLLYDSIIIHNLQLSTPVEIKDTLLVIGTFFGWREVTSSSEGSIWNLYGNYDENNCLIITLYNISVIEYTSVEDSIDLELCQGDYFNDILIVNDTTISEVHPIRIGFDSIIHNIINVLPSPDTLLNVVVCDDDEYRFLDYNFYETGQYEIPLAGPNGCDSTIHLDLSFGVSHDTSIFHELIIGELFEGIPISNDTIITSNYLTNIGCDSIVRNIITIQTSSVQYFDKNQYLNVFPNPTSGDLNIEIKGLEAEELNINLLDVHGKICLSRKWNIRNNGEKQVLKLELKDQVKGVYFIDFQSVKSRTIRKVIKQ